MRTRSYVYATALAIGSLGNVSANVPIFHDGIMDFVIAQDFTQMTKDYPDATIDKAFINGEEKYKLEITQESGTSLEIYSDARGNWIEM